MAALIGTAIDRNTAMSSRNDSRTTPPMTQSSRCENRGGGVDAGRRDARRRGAWAGVPATTGGITFVAQVVHERLGGAVSGATSSGWRRSRAVSPAGLVCGASDGGDAVGGLHGAGHVLGQAGAATRAAGRRR